LGFREGATLLVAAVVLPVALGPAPFETAVLPVGAFADVLPPGLLVFAAGRVVAVPASTFGLIVATPDVDVAKPEVLTPEVLSPEVLTPEVLTPEVLTPVRFAPRERGGWLASEAGLGFATTSS